MNPATISLSVNAYGKLIIWMWLGAPPMIHWAGRIFLHITRLSYVMVARSANDLTWRHVLHFIRACELPTGVLRVAAPASGLARMSPSSYCGRNDFGFPRPCASDNLEIASIEINGRLPVWSE